MLEWFVISGSCQASDAGGSSERPAKRQKTGSPVKDEEEEAESAPPKASSSSPKAKQKADESKADVGSGDEVRRSEAPSNGMRHKG